MGDSCGRKSRHKLIRANEVKRNYMIPGTLTRLLLSRFLCRTVPALRVIANSEVPESRTIRIMGMVGTG